MTPRVFAYDTTLRDGTQGEGFALSVTEKIRVAHLLDELGIAYIEGGWPGSNPRDVAFFAAAAKERFQHARMTAFGSTRRAGISCDHDANLAALVAAEVPVVTIFGKSWRFQATDVLGISAEENLELIHDSVRWLTARVDEVIFDAEHFFDGAADDEAYAIAALQAAASAGAKFVVLCDTNGGTLPTQVGALVDRVRSQVDCAVGIHAHNDGEVAVANSLEAVRRGATMVQGTINGYGERCGNANLVSILPNLEIKMGFDVVGPERISRLTHVSRMVDELSNNVPLARQAFVGQSAFAHKGGVHVHAVMKDARAYEHIDPTRVGNARRVLMSDLSGRSNVVYKAREFGYELNPSDPATRTVLERIKQMENAGYAFEDAEASMKLLLAEAHGHRPHYFTIEEADVTTSLLQDGARHDADESHRTRAIMRVKIGDESVPMVQYGNGPVDALGRALEAVVVRAWPVVHEVRLVDYKVRIMDSGDGIGATVRVLIRASDGKQTWTTVGVSSNVIEASWRALVDLYEYKLMEEGIPGVASATHGAVFSA